jgi:hypothetical protein
MGLRAQFLTFFLIGVLIAIVIFRFLTPLTFKSFIASVVLIIVGVLIFVVYIK